MIGIARAEDTRLISDGQDGWIAVPDIKLPQGVEFRAYKLAGQEAFIVEFAHDGETATTLWHGPHDVGGQKMYIIDAPKRVLIMLQNQLGAGNVAPLIKALRAKPGLRAWCKAKGWTLIRNGNGVPVSVMPPLVICGTSPVDLDDDELDTAEELPDLE